MKKIDRETVQRILDAADIVEVVSDFVHLKRRGSSYLGLCPFHNERTPSFSVSKSKNICKCFSCGKGGSPVNFIMEHEQMSYYEALRYLARKYNIEIKEHEMSDKEREEESERESMLAVNDFALKHFEKNLQETDDGRDIGLSYFLDRGINEASIKKFRLGYSLEKSNDLLNAAKSRGYNEKYLIETGLCIKTDQGRVYDRFKGRVMFPVFSISGKVIAFGGRTLKKDVAKYVNSPESLIYKKSYQLYGLYQAKQAIVKHDKCILVEGYMDVISMHQSGIENVVASSGTSLTDGQIRLIHRFTDNVTVIYDGDAAGIKASLRGIDMLLAEGLDIKVLLLPDGDDPDSFAQKHTSSELEEYI
ncbi:DNA primase, partial [uncultured Muribaculum sp.]